MNGHARAVDAGDEYLVFLAGVRALWPVDLTQYRRAQMERRIRTFAARRGTGTLSEYLGVLRGDDEELSRFVAHLTINVSQLWRHPEQWDVLRDAVLPELGREGRVRAWSAGCSYGAEAYTLAAEAREACPTAKLSILGTDVDRHVVARAATGCFTDADARDAPRETLERWFHRDGGGWKAKSELRFGMTFEEGDLLHTAMPNASLDLILCRNVVIYFTEDVRDALHRRFAAALRPGGYLVVGATERVSEPRPLGLIATRPFVYRKA